MVQVTLHDDSEIVFHKVHLATLYKAESYIK